MWARPTPMWCRGPGAQRDGAGLIDAVSADASSVLVGLPTLPGNHARRQPKKLFKPLRNIWKPSVARSRPPMRARMATALGFNRASRPPI